MVHSPRDSWSTVSEEQRGWATAATRPSVGGVVGDVLDTPHHQAPVILTVHTPQRSLSAHPSPQACWRPGLQSTEGGSQGPEAEHTPNAQPGDGCQPNLS